MEQSPKLFLFKTTSEPGWSAVGAIDCFCRPFSTPWLLPLQAPNEAEGTQFLIPHPLLFKMPRCAALPASLASREQDNISFLGPRSTALHPARHICRKMLQYLDLDWLASLEIRTSARPHPLVGMIWPTAERVDRHWVIRLHRVR